MAKKAQNYQLAHSKAKIEFYETFLNKYLKMLLNMPNVQEVNVYDVFCGRGVYEDGSTGSAIHAYETIGRIKAEKEQSPLVRLYFNDANIKHVSSLQNCIANLPPAADGMHLTYSTYDATEWLKHLAEEWKGNTNYRKRNILFIDPYGYKELDRKVLEQLVCSCHADVLLFLPISFMHRFTRYAFHEDANLGAQPLKLFIQSYFEDSHPIHDESQEMNVHQYIDWLTEAFSHGGRNYSTSYQIERDRKNYFALFYMTKSLMGYEKIVEAKWKLDEENGIGFKLPELIPDLFADQWKSERQMELYSRLHLLLVGCLSQNGQMDNATIYELILQHGFLPAHAKMVLTDMQKRGEVSCFKTDSGAEAKEGVFYLSFRYYRKPCAVITYNR